MTNPKQKFSHPDITAKGEVRASVAPVNLETLWFNTGTLCNLACHNCYIESSPKNDRLVYLSLNDVVSYLDEIASKDFKTTEIGFTGGEPFMNLAMISILEETLKRGYKVLVLTNAMKPMHKKKEALLSLKESYGDKLVLRVSLDHYTQELHEKERGPKSWEPAIEGLVWLSENSFNIDVAGRTCWHESEDEIRKGFAKLFKEKNIDIDAFNPSQLVLFPEMQEGEDVPEITIACWDILKKSPADIMCASSRMIVKRKGREKAEVVACTLLPNDEEFSLGQTLSEAWQPVKLNHEYCAKFCVLGGGSCS
ncbi:MAG: radical SAM protein [Bdellovibrionales bacterium]|nr:radical SAM protein [Bdellovibrionales bacterium]